MAKFGTFVSPVSPQTRRLGIELDRRIRRAEARITGSGSITIDDGSSLLDGTVDLDDGTAPLGGPFILDDGGS